MTKRFTLALVEHQGHLYSFEKTSSSAEVSWENLSVKGESAWPVQGDHSWHLVLQEINGQLNLSSKLAECWIYWFVEDTSQAAMQRLQSLHGEFDIRHWSLLHWQGLQELGLIGEQDAKQALNLWIANQLTNLLAPTPELPESKEETPENSAEADLIERLAQEKQQLKKEKKQLEKQLQNQQEQLDYLKNRLENLATAQMDIDTLTLYLPVLYKNFWGQIRPDELALLAGSLQIPEITSPAREPDSGVLQVMKKRLQNMPPEQQDQLRQFCLQLPHAPQPRPEMAFFFEADH
ncbi:MAG: hypothetical protein IBX50_17540 [Marinospirillum sp.]|uniref:hypothetical protein n=1 Tax=Marinospirillum sp. TaxID=2183934 RepID=UPI0019EAD6DE|nr:hypothetical protein [Marinospirillum sp.]MBE0508494.1 hypothetical protein [Marinospirillum sp.]